MCDRCGDPECTGEPDEFTTLWFHWAEGAIGWAAMVPGAREWGRATKAEREAMTPFMPPRPVVIARLAEIVKRRFGNRTKIAGGWEITLCTETVLEYANRIAKGEAKVEDPYEPPAVPIS